MAKTRISMNLQRIAEANATPYTKSAHEYGKKHYGDLVGIGSSPAQIAGYLKHKILAGNLSVHADLVRVIELANEDERRALTADPQVKRALEEYEESKQVSRLSVDRRTVTHG